MAMTVVRFTAALILAQVVPAHAPPPGPRTGIIIGQVVDATSAEPIAGAIVQLTMPKHFNNPAAPNSRVMADDNGRYFFADLPAGDYSITASKEGYSGSAFVQRGVAGEPQLLSLGEGERRTDVKRLLWKWATLGGSVLDEAGEPVVGVSVYALSRDFQAGRPRYGKMNTQPFAVPTATTDDRGVFRISRLAPAGYIVVVPSTQITVPVSIAGGFSQSSQPRSDLLMAVAPNGSSNVNTIYETFPLGQSRAQQIGDAALLTLNNAQVPPPAGTTGRLDVYRTTYYPAAMTAATASVITLKSGEERTDANVKLQPSSAVRVSGRLVTPSGAAPPPTPIRLVGESAMDVADDGFETVIGMSDSGGRFTLLGVPPGEYVIKNVNNTFAPAHQQGLPALWVQQRVSVGSKDIDDLTVELRSELRLEGRVEFRGAGGRAPEPRDVAPRDIVFEPPLGAQSMFSPRAQYINGATFATFGTAGQYIVRPGEAAGWVVESVTLDGKNIAESVIDVNDDTVSLLVVYTDRRSTVSGTIKNANGSPSSTAAAFAFPADPTRWSGYGANPRTVKGATRSRDGAYSFDHLPAGEYFVIAIDSAKTENWTDPKRLEVLSREAIKVTVVTGESKTLDLTLKVIR